jgi:hypothetical protein
MIASNLNTRIARTDPIAARAAHGRDARIYPQTQLQRLDFTRLHQVHRSQVIRVGLGSGSR